jgi:hypothetical protein
MRFERRTGSFTASWSGFAAKRETESELQTGGSERCGDVNYTACYAIFLKSVYATPFLNFNSLCQSDGSSQQNTMKLVNKIDFPIHNCGIISWFNT